MTSNTTPRDDVVLPPESAEITVRLWSSRRYIVWLISDTSKGLAGTLFSFAVPLLALIVTNDPAKAGVLGGVGLAVSVVSTLAGGILADRHSRIGMMTIGAALGAIISAALTAIAWWGTLSFTLLMVFQVLLALRTGIFSTAGEAALRDVVPQGAMGRAQAANQGRDAALELVGNPLGGALLGVGGWLVGLTMTVAHSVSALTAAMLLRKKALAHTYTGTESPVLSPPEDTAPEKTSALAEIREGFLWILSRSDMRGTLFCATLINVGINTALSTVTYALQQNGYSTVAIGTMSSAIGLVMLVGALAAPFLVPRISAGLLVITGLVLTALTVALLPLVGTPLGVAAVLAPGVLLVPALNSGLLGYFMVAVPHELLGRANSAVSFFAMGAMPLAPLIAGFGLAHIGRAGTLMIGAAICAAGSAMAIGTRGLRELPKESEWVEHAKKFERLEDAANPAS